MYKKPLFCGLLLLSITGCASQVPTLVRLEPEQDISYQQVKGNTGSFKDQYVRWGGKIISVENKQDSTWVEILAKPLSGYGRPDTGEEYDGRFIARLDGFVDPEHFEKDRSLTVYGKVESKLTRMIDDHPYEYPLVHVSEHYLWPEYRRSDRNYHPYYPGYYPYHRFRHPYYRYHLGFHHFHSF